MTTEEIIKELQIYSSLAVREAIRKLEELERELTESIRERNKTVADLIKQRDEALFDCALSDRSKTSRLEIAAMAMQGLLSSGGFVIDIPKTSFEYADALIAEAKEDK